MRPRRRDVGANDRGAAIANQSALGLLPLELLQHLARGGADRDRQKHIRSRTSCAHEQLHDVVAGVGTVIGAMTSAGRSAARPDGLTIADELVLLHTFPRAKRDISMANVGTSAAVGVLAELVLAGRVEISTIDPEQLGWFKRKLGQHEGAHRLRLSVLDPAPRGEQPLDSVLQRLAGMQGKDLPWCIARLHKLWLEVNSGLVDKGVKLRVDKRGNGGGVDSAVEAGVQQRLRRALSDPGTADTHSGAVLLIARAGELFKSGSRERELIGPIDDTTLRGQLAKLAALPSLVDVERLARAGAQTRAEQRERTAQRSDAIVWHE